jgi:hypothetical protein
MRLYSAQKYDKIVKRLNTFRKYQYVKINDYHFLYLAISENNQEFCDTFLKKINYKEKVLSDESNPSSFLPHVFAAMNGLNDITFLLQKSH